MKLVIVVSILALSTSVMATPFQAVVGSVQVTEGERAVLLEAQQHGLDRQQKLPANESEINSAPVDQQLSEEVPVNSPITNLTKEIASDNLNSFDQK